MDVVGFRIKIIRETVDDSGKGYVCEFLPDQDLPFELTEELKNRLFSAYEQSTM